MKIYLSFIGILFSSCVLASTYLVSDSQGFKDRLNNLFPGDTLVLENGYYSDWGRIDFNAIKGTPDNPVVITTEKLWGATISGNTFFKFIDCDYLHLSGFRFTQPTAWRCVWFINSNHCKVSRCSFTHYGTASVSRIAVRFDNGEVPSTIRNAYNTIEYCYFQNIVGNAISIVLPDSADNIGGHRIVNNVFRNAPNVLDNGGEAIVLYTHGLQKNNPLNTLVEGNLFDKWEGDPEIITNKSASNIFRHNVFCNAQRGFLSLRRENASVVEKNIFYNMDRGLWVYGKSHQIKNNLFVNLNSEAIRLSHDGSAGSVKFEVADSNLIAHNTFLNVSGKIVNFYQDETYYYGSAPKGNSILNNVFSSSSGIFIATQQEHRDSNLIGYNLYHNRSAAQIPALNSGDIVADPLLEGELPFVAIMEGSPCIHNGYNIESVVDDFHGTIRPVGGIVDIGHIEYATEASFKWTNLVFPIPPDTSGYSNLPVNAAFHHFPEDMKSGEIICFDAAASKGQKNFVDYQWVINNKDTLTNKENVMFYVFNDSGVYDVKLFLLDKDGLIVGTTVNQVFIEDASLPQLPVSLPQKQSDTFSAALYPNPFSHKLTIETQSPGYLSIYNLNGNLVYTGEISSRAEVNTHSWQAGAYVVYIQGNDEVFVRKVVLIK